jgi:hypothetical protein
MATITTDTFLDTASGGRTAGETWAVNGCNFTIRTDTRVYSGAPASMTGSLGSVTIDTGKGGGIYIDATNIRWMPFNSGTGNVPAIGTSITQDAVSGYLLGVWADYVSAPTAAGAAMPSTGYLKFREVTGGTFSPAALTGIGASATSPDVIGWLEVVMDAASSFATYDLGTGVNFNGNWFSVGTTSGTRGQQLNVPTNGGGTGTHVFAVQIETAPGSGVYDWFPTAGLTTGQSNWATANFNTDLRSKFVESMGNGVIRIGSDGTNNIGYLPASGCNVRIPNIFGRTVTAAARATNQLPTGAISRGQITGGNVTINCAHLDFQSVAGQTIKSTISNFVGDTRWTLTDNFAPIVWNNVCLGGFTGAANFNPLSMNRVNNGTFNNLKLIGYNYTFGNIVNASQMANCNFNGLEIINAKARTGQCFGFGNSTFNNCNFTNVKTKGVTSYNLTLATNCTFTNTDFVDRLNGDTDSTNSQNIASISACQSLTFDGVTFGESGQLTNTQCYSSLFSTSTVTNGFIKIRNIGTKTNPLPCGTPAISPSNLASITSFNYGFVFQRCFLSNVRTSLFAMPSNVANCLVEDVAAQYALLVPTNFGVDAIYRKLGGTEAAGVPNANLGGHWVDGFISDTSGYVKWIGAAPSATSSSLNNLSVTASAGTGYISSACQISLDNLNDAAFSEVTYQFKGHTSFQNAAPVLSGVTAGMTVYYQIDTGSGYGGTWKLANGANLSGETISASGFKMKVKILQTQVIGTNGATTGISAIKFLTNSTLTAQASNQYPLDTVNLNFTGLQVGSEVQAYVGTNPATSTLIGGVQSTVGSTFSFTHSVGGQTGYIMIFALGYVPIRIPYTYKTSDDSLLIQQTLDRTYST